MNDKELKQLLKEEQYKKQIFDLRHSCRFLQGEIVDFINISFICFTLITITIILR